MKISIFTPTHNPQYIQEAYDSLLNQTYHDWEWVILTNGADVNNVYHTVRKLTVEDERVTVNKAPSSCYVDSSRKDCNIGALKNHCVSLCTGDYVLELDHDDLLAPNALFDIVSTISIDSPDFIYSDFCEFRSDGSSNVYSSDYGWESYEFDSDILPAKSPYVAMKAQEVSPRTLYEIFYAPNHVRVWKKEFYDSIGGHSDMKEYLDVFNANKGVILEAKNKRGFKDWQPSLKIDEITYNGVCDDHDLLCRTYLAGG